MKITFPLALFLLLLALKLTGVIAWSWLWVTAPLWFGLVFGVAVLGLFTLIVGLHVAKKR